MAILIISVDKIKTYTTHFRDRYKSELELASNLLELLLHQLDCLLNNHAHIKTLSFNLFHE